MTVYILLFCFNTVHFSALPPAGEGQPVLLPRGAHFCPMNYYVDEIIPQEKQQMFKACAQEIEAFSPASENKSM